jgi:hypothetical protein
MEEEKEELPSEIKKLWEKWEKEQYEIGRQFVVVDHKLHDVTPEMIDWWWPNMDKGYILWEPNDHKAFHWIVPPRKDSPIGSIHYVEEILDGKIIKGRLRRESSELSPIPIIYEHANLAAVLGPDDKIVTYVLHQYEATSYGTRMRSTFYSVDSAATWSREAIIKHNKSEMGRFSDFLPQLYKLWRVVKDPSINRKFSFKVKRRNFKSVY